MNEDIFEVVRALRLHILGHVDDGLENWDYEACHKDFVGIEVWSIKIICREESCLSRVRWQAYSRIVLCEVEL